MNIARISAANTNFGIKLPKVGQKKQAEETKRDEMVQCNCGPNYVFYVKKATPDSIKGVEAQAVRPELAKAADAEKQAHVERSILLGLPPYGG